MAKIINITDKLSNEKPRLQIGDKLYEVNDGMNIVLKFEELANDTSIESMMKAIEITLGAEAVQELNIETMSIPNFKVLVTAILAAVQGIEYDDAAARFQKTIEQ